MHEHRGAVTSAAFSPDSTCVVTTSIDGTARVWEASTGNPGPVLQHKPAVRSAVFSPPDGKLVLTTSADGTARIYACEVCGSIADLLALAHTRALKK